MSTPTPPSLRVLAIDPGFARAGVAVLERVGGKEVVLYSSCVETAPGETFSKRLTAVLKAIEALLRKYSPTHVALERIYLTNNQKTAMEIAEVRGALIALAGAHELILLEYSPPQIKIAITGFGRSSKSDLMRMIPRLVTLSTHPRLDDEYDAIAIGLTALASTGTSRSLSTQG